MKKLLIIAEGATLAHVARPLALARAAAPGFEVVLALPPRYHWALGDLAVQTSDLVAQSPAEFARRLAKGDPLYDLTTLERYVEDDLALIERVQPDCIVGDFRLSLAVSARLAGVRYFALGNAYWSPCYETGRDWPVPELPLTRVLPIGLARWLFNRVRPSAFRLHARAMEALRRNHGVEGVGGDLRRVYTDADMTFYTDIPSVFALRDAPSSQRVVGPLAWAPPIGLPEWWGDLPDDRPFAYVSMGSSGRQELAQPISRALADGGFRVLVTAPPENYRECPTIHAAPLLPGDRACELASVVICNGGSPTSQQALAAGRPVIGVASNLDQHLNMAALERAGLGILLRADRFNGAEVMKSVRHVSESGAVRAQATRVSAEIAGLDAAAAVLGAVQAR